MNCLGFNGVPAVFRRPQLPEVCNSVAGVRAIADFICFFIAALAEVCGVYATKGGAPSPYGRGNAV